MSSSNIKLTAEQSLALDYSKNLAVSAGAGSGKTRVLVERYINILRDNPNINPHKILAITFTRKAAAEMKSRIRQRLADPCIDIPRKRKLTLLSSLTNAPICTIHSFTADMLREFPVEAGLDPQFNVIDESEFKVGLLTLTRQFLHDASRDDRLTSHLRQLIPYFTHRQLINLLCEFVSNAIRFDTMINAKKTTPPWDKLRQLIKSNITTTVEFNSALVTLKKHSCRTPANDRRRLILLEHLQSLNPSAGLKSYFYSFDSIIDILFTKKGSGKKTDKWHEMSGPAIDLQALFSPYTWIKGIYHPASEDIINEARNAFFCLLNHLFIKIQTFKKTIGVCTFNDLEYYAIKLLETSPDRTVISGILRSRYRFIMIDEFQDTNDVQWRIIKPLVSSDDGNLLADKLFIVGDAKQSIYGFRGADVTVFSRVRQDIVSTNQQNTQQLVQTKNPVNTNVMNRPGNIHLLRNFRSSPSILRFIDQICKPMLTGGESFEVTHETLIPCRSDSDSNHIEMLIPSKSENTASTVDTSASGGNPDPWQFLADHLVNGIKTDRWNAGDIAVLFPRRTRLIQLEQALRDRDVPFIVYKGVGFWRRQEVQELLALAIWLADPSRKIELFTSLRSPVFGFTADMLFFTGQFWKQYPDGHSSQNPESYLSRTELNALLNTADLLKSYKNLAGKIPLYRILNEILDSTGAWFNYQLDSEGSRIPANIERLLEFFLQPELSTGNALNDIVRLLSYFQGGNHDFGEEPRETDNSEYVKLMTVHAAKGLEFPVVYLTGLEFPAEVSSPPFDFDDEWGMGISLTERLNPKIKFSSPTYNIIRAKRKRQQIAEYKRLFYVAMTRAENYLILHLNNPYSKTSPLENVKDNSWLQWTLNAIPLAAPDGAVRTMKLKSEVNDAYNVKILTDNSAQRKIERTSGEQFDWRLISELPRERQPISVGPVSQKQHGSLLLSPTRLDSFCKDPESYYRRHVLNLPDSFRSLKTKSRKDLSQTIGTVFHEMLQYGIIDSKSGIEKFLSAKSYQLGLDRISESVFQARIRKMIQLLFTWPRWKEIQNASCFKEIPFSIPIGSAIIEGVIDCIYLVNNKWHILDYKTDAYDEAESLDTWVQRHIEHHKFQMEVYALALSRIIPLNQSELPVILYFSDAAVEGRLAFTNEDLHVTSQSIENLIPKLSNLEMLNPRSK